MRTQGQVALLNALELACEKGLIVVIDMMRPMTTEETENLAERLRGAFDRNVYGVDVPYTHFRTAHELQLLSTEYNRKII